METGGGGADTEAPRATPGHVLREARCVPQGLWGAGLTRSSWVPVRSWVFLGRSPGLPLTALNTHTQGDQGTSVKPRRVPGRPGP